MLRRRYELNMRDALGRLKANVYKTKQGNYVLRLYTLRLWRRHLATAMDKWTRVTALERRREAGIKQIYACLLRKWKRRRKARLTKAWWKWLQVLASQRQREQKTAQVSAFPFYQNDSIGNVSVFLLLTLNLQKVLQRVLSLRNISKASKSFETWKVPPLYQSGMGNTL